MTELPRDRAAREDADAPEAGIETGSAPQPLDFPGADTEPPGRPDGDPEPDEDAEPDEDVEPDDDVDDTGA